MSSMSGKSVRETFGVLAVVAGLVFVGVQIRQSNSWARQEALQSIINDWANIQVPWALDERFSQLAETINSGARQADFSGADRQSLSIMFLAVDHMWELRYKQLQGSILSAGDVQFPRPGNLWYNSNFHRELWATDRPAFDPAFAGFWEARFGLLEPVTGQGRP